MTTSNQQLAQKPKFSVMITTQSYQNLINNTLRDQDRARSFTASITSAVAVNPALQECDAGTILAGALLGESLKLSPSPQLGQYYLVPFKNKRQQTVTAQFVLGYKGYIQLALRSGQYKDLDVMVIKQGEYSGKDPETGKARFKFIEDDDVRDALPTVGYMAFFEYLNARAVLDALTAQRIEAKDAKIAEQNQQLFAAQLAASQAAQNETLKAYMSGQLAYYNPRPVPAFTVPAPYQYGNCGMCA